MHLLVGTIDLFPTAFGSKLSGFSFFEASSCAVGGGWCFVCGLTATAMAEAVHLTIDFTANTNLIHDCPTYVRR